MPYATATKAVQSALGRLPAELQIRLSEVLPEP
jgi:hypothetical protein